MTPKQRISLVFRHALRLKADDRSVLVKAADLIEAFGASAARQEFGVDHDGVSAATDSARQGRLAELGREQDELRQLAEAGFRDARRRLKRVQAEERQVRSGQLRPQALVRVSVEALRRLAQHALTSDRSGTRTRPVPPADAPSPS